MKLIIKNAVLQFVHPVKPSHHKWYMYICFPNFSAHSQNFHFIFIYNSQPFHSNNFTIGSYVHDMLSGVTIYLQWAASKFLTPKIGFTNDRISTSISLDMRTDTSKQFQNIMTKIIILTDENTHLFRQLQWKFPPIELLLWKIRLEWNDVLIYVCIYVYSPRIIPLVRFKKNNLTM